MGLDISAISKIVKTSDNLDDDSCGFYLHKGAFEYFERDSGVYECTGPSTSFRAGAYSSYNRWRKLLCEAALGYSPETLWEAHEGRVDIPFYYLIFFSDCEGTIGTRVSKILHTQFVENRRRIIRNITDELMLEKETEDPFAFETEFNMRFELHPSEVEWFCSIYDKFTEAFEIASDEGAVIFH
jgi:hypothetical protein